MLAGVALDAYMNASLVATTPASTLHATRQRANRSSINVKAAKKRLAIDLRAQQDLARRLRAGRAIHHQRKPPLPNRWHVTHQQRLFAILAEAWPSGPRVFVDLGCHAGHGKHMNVSDATLFLDFFHDAGGRVLAVDAIEDYAHDLQYRFDSVPPYRDMHQVEKRAVSLAISHVDGSHVNLWGAMRKMVNCCADRCLMPAPFCCGHRSQVLERRGSDHICMITRMRLGILPPDGRTAHPSIHASPTTTAPTACSRRLQRPVREPTRCGGGSSAARASTCSRSTWMRSGATWA